MHYTKLYKICLPSHCLFCLKKFDAYLEKVRIFEHNFKKIFRLLQLLSNFYYCFQAAAKTNMIFHYGKKCAGRFVDHKYSSNFLSTVPTFGFRISIVDSVRSQNFMKNWLSEVQKFYWISLLFEWPTFNSKSVKFAQRLTKIINNHYGVVKVVPYYKTGRKLLLYFSDKIKNQV